MRRRVADVVDEHGALEDAFGLFLYSLVNWPRNVIDERVCVQHAFGRLNRQIFFSIYI